MGAAASVLEELGLLKGVARVTVTSESARIDVGVEGAVADVMRRLVAAGVTSVRVTRPSLEEVYIGLVGDRGLEV